MKNKIMFLALTLLSSHVMAEYSMKYPLEDMANITVEPALQNGTPIITAWNNVGSPSNCSSYSPELTDFISGDKFVQTYLGCSQMQERTVTPTLFNPQTGVTTNGTPYQESQTLSNYRYTLVQIGTGKKACSKYFNYNGTSVWQELAININDSPNMGYGIYWKGMPVKSLMNYVKQDRISSMEVDGYRYTRGEYVNLQYQGNGYTTYNYEICKELIE